MPILERKRDRRGCSHAWLLDAMFLGIAKTRPQFSSTSSDPYMGSTAKTLSWDGSCAFHPGMIFVYVGLVSTSVLKLLFYIAV